MEYIVFLFGAVVMVFIIIFSKQTPTSKSFLDKIKQNFKNNNTTVNEEKDNRNKLKKLLGINNIIQDGTVIMDDHTYARVFYLSSQDVDLMSEAEEEALELNLIAAMRALDCPVQFFTTTQRVDTTQQVKEIDQALKDPETIVSTTLIQYCQNLKLELENLQKRKELVVRKSYMVVFVKEPNEKIALEKLDQRTKNIVVLLKKSGFKIFQLTLSEVLQLIGDELNKNQVFKVEQAIKSGALDLFITSKRGIVIDDDVIQEVKIREFETIKG